MAIEDTLSGAGIPYPLARSIIFGLANSTTDVRISAHGVPGPVAIELARQINAKTINVQNLMSLGMSGAAASAIALAAGGGGGTTTRRLMGQGGTFADGAQNGTYKSNGTDNTFNVDQLWSTDIAIPNPAAIFTGFVVAAGSEGDIGNSVQYHVILYLAGGGTLDFGTTDVASGAIFATSAQLAGQTIPVGNHRWKIFGKVPNGGFFYKTSKFRSNASTGYGIAETGVDLPDKAAGGTITSQTIFLPQTILGVQGDCPAVHRVFAQDGDSNGDGTGFGPTPKGVGSGYMAAHLEAAKVSYVQMGRSGAGPSVNRVAHSKRTAFMAAAGITDWWSHQATNDYYSSNVNAANEKLYMKELLDKVIAGNPGIRTYWATVPPITNITSPPSGASNQTRRNNPAANPATYDVDDRRLVVNQWLRDGGLVGLTGYTEAAIPVQRSEDPYLWTDGASTDGLHFIAAGGAAVLAALQTANPMGLTFS